MKVRATVARRTCYTKIFKFIPPKSGYMFTSQIYNGEPRAASLFLFLPVPLRVDVMKHSLRKKKERSKKKCNTELERRRETR